MPGFDGTGPNGSGPLGCGLGRGRGAGAGRGFGRRVGNFNLPLRRNSQQEQNPDLSEAIENEAQSSELSLKEDNKKLEQRIALLETELVSLKKQLGEE